MGVVEGGYIIDLLFLYLFVGYNFLIVIKVELG